MKPADTYSDAKSNCYSGTGAMICAFFVLTGCGDDIGSLFPSKQALLTARMGNLPVVIIGTRNEEIPDQHRIVAGMQIVNTDDPYRGMIDIEIRGQTSARFQKKSFGFSTLDSLGEETDVSLLGMPAESDWILNGPYVDKTLIRNVLVYWIANQMGRYATRTRFVELFVNEAYRGVYVLMEKIKRGEHRVPISKNKSGKLGGYILKNDKGDDSGFSSRSGNRYKYVYPKGAKITDGQKRQVQNIVRDFERSIASGSYETQIDVDSFVDYLIISELTKNVDAYRLSTYLHVDPSKGIKVTMGPVWDYNVALGNAGFCQGPEDGSSHSTDLWAYNYHEYCARSASDGNIPLWWEQLLDDPAFRAKIVERWNELRGGVLARDSLFQRIDRFVAELGDAVDRNFDVWDVLGREVWLSNTSFRTHDKEVAYLKDWISNRLKWLDARLTARYSERKDPWQNLLGGN